MNHRITFTTAILLPAILALVAQLALLSYSIGAHSSSTTKKETFFNSSTYIGGQLKSAKRQWKISHLDISVTEFTDASEN